MKYSAYQEYYIEQIVAYSVQAGDILSKEVGETNPKFRHMFLPYGPDLYTGPLKAAGYLLLDPEIDHIILITKQIQYPMKVTVFEESEGLIALGKHFSVVPLSIPTAHLVQEIDEEILFQINFLSLLKNIHKITILGLGVDVDMVDFGKQLKTIGKTKKIGIILYDTCSDKVSHTKARTTDELAMRQILKKKPSNLLKTKCRLANLFVVSLPSKAKPELIGYVNTGDFGGNQKKTTSYASLIA